MTRTAIILLLARGNVAYANMICVFNFEWTRSKNTGWETWQDGRCKEPASQALCHVISQSGDLELSTLRLRTISEKIIHGINKKFRGHRSGLSPHPVSENYGVSAWYSLAQTVWDSWSPLCLLFRW
jgi:hypothetical protein